MQTEQVGQSLLIEKIERGKSEHRRAASRITSGRRIFRNLATTSATENKPAFVGGAIRSRIVPGTLVMDETVR